MSRTLKDLKSHKKGFGQYGMKKPQRKLTPFIHDANKIAGRNEVLYLLLKMISNRMILKKVIIGIMQRLSGH